MFQIRVSFLALFIILHMSPQGSIGADESEGAATESLSISDSISIEADPLSGPDDVETLKQNFREEKNDVLNQNLLENWETLKSTTEEETGFSFGGDYTSVGLAASSSLGDDNAASGIARFFGSWELLNRSAKNTGSFVYKIEHRHKYTDVPPQFFGGELGYTGSPEPVFNDDDFRTTELYWKQNFMEDKGVFRVGFVDIKQYFDVYALASPWTGFHNLAFSTGSNTQLVLPDGAFGAMIGGYLTDNVYAAVGIADASADPTMVFDGFNTFFNDFDTLKTFEIGITGGGQRLFVDNAHIAVWQLDDISRTGAPGGWGINTSVSKLVDGQWLPFLRTGWAHEGGGLYESSVSAGFGYMSEPGGNLLGVGLNWGRPNSDTFPIDLNDQWTSEIFYRVQLSENLQVSPSVQFLVDPALNPGKDFIALFGLRAHATF